MTTGARDVIELRTRAINSLVLSIELFNRPNDKGRPEGVVIFLHHAYEMLLKAIIRNRRGTVHAGKGKFSYSFDQCLTMCCDDLGTLTQDQRFYLSILDAHRDTSAHYYQDLSEDLLYVMAQAGVSLFRDLLAQAFNMKLADLLPERVLPVSTHPPTEFHLLVGQELSQVDALLDPGRRTTAKAAAKLRPILALATASRDDDDRVSEAELERAIARRRQGDEWTVIFPEVAQLRLDSEGDGIPLPLRIVKDAELAVRVAREGDEVFGTLIKQEVNIWDKFNLSSKDIAQKLALSQPRTLALIYELGVQDDRESYRVLRKGGTRLQGYSKKGLDTLRQALRNGINPEDVWPKWSARLCGHKMRRR